jgi:hypothetical protein
MGNREQGTKESGKTSLRNWPDFGNAIYFRFVLRFRE